MKFKLSTSTNFRKQYKLIEGSIKNKVDKIIKKLEDGMEGELLNKDLLSFYAIHFHRNKFRLVYHKAKNSSKIVLVHVGKRVPKFYDKFEDNVKRKGKFYDKDNFGDDYSPCIQEN